MTVKLINKAGIDLIKSFEGLSLVAYPDPGTGGAPWTIGYGHTGPEVKAGTHITQGQADALLRGDVARFEDVVDRLCPATTDNQFAALVSFAFNCGPANLAGSTLQKKHNAGDYDGAQAEFGKWTHAAGKVLPGLTKRRAAEAALYGSEA